MAEAIGIAASVIGIVGFAGQLLQGCQIVRSFLDDMKEAPAYVEDLRTILRAFQASLAAVVSKFNDEDTGGEDLRLALEYSGKCIRSLKVIVDNLQGANSVLKISFAVVRWKSKIIKEVENLKMAMALLNGAQMNQVGTALENVYGRLVQSQMDSQGLYTLVKQTQRTSMIPAPSWRQNHRRKLAKLTSGEPSSSKSTWAHTHGLQKLQAGMEEGRKMPLSVLDEAKMFKSIDSLSPASTSAMRVEFQKDHGFNFGSCNYLPSDYVEAVKDTIRGVLVEFFFQTRSQSGLEAAANLGSSQLAMIQKQKGIIQTREILDREFEEQKYQRALGLVTVTRTTTKWITTHMDNSYYRETRIQVYLDLEPQRDPSQRFRLFCISTFDGNPRYEPKFDLVLRVSNRVRYNDPIVVACRGGNLDNARMLFASRLASPYDCCEADTNISLLDIIFRQLILNLDAPASPSNYMAKLHQLFKYLVDLGLDPGELNIQYRHPASSLYKPSNGFYVLRCSYCFEEIEGMYYDCRFPIESLASVYYAKENGPYLVDAARIILCRSKQDPFQDNYGRLLEWRQYEELADVESPVLRLISYQQEWVFRWDENKPESLSNIPSTWKPQDPVGLLLRAWIENIIKRKSFFGVHDVFKHVSYLLDSDEMQAEFCRRAAPIIDCNPWCISLLLWERYLWPLRRPSLEDLLSRCIATRSIKGYRRLISKYSPTGEPPFPYKLDFYFGTNCGARISAFLTRQAAKGKETAIGNSDKMGVCLLDVAPSRTIIFYDGLFGAAWFLVK
ncbi:hypothetical protein N431DRAFT_511773 [Stipitochalara longipes BDJ]|nr:hypothetical protein N431DRAFT_511773 [Stipitochalara longipes BDJ]